MAAQPLHSRTGAIPFGSFECASAMDSDTAAGSLRLAAPTSSTSALKAFAAAEPASLIDTPSAREVFENNTIYAFSHGFKDPDFFIRNLVERFRLTRYEASGTTKVVFRNEDAEIVKVVFSGRQYYPLERSIKELEFLLSNPDISNKPQEITLYLSNLDRQAFRTKYEGFITAHSIHIEEIDEPNFEGALVWKEEPYEQSVYDFEKKPVRSPWYLERMQAILSFWQEIQAAIAGGRRYMVQDLRAVNIGVFKNHRVKIIDARPSDTPLALEEVIQNIRRYEQLLAKT